MTNQNQKDNLNVKLEQISRKVQKVISRAESLEDKARYLVGSYRELQSLTDREIQLLNYGHRKDNKIYLPWVQQAIMERKLPNRASVEDFQRAFEYDVLGPGLIGTLYKPTEDGNEYLLQKQLEEMLVKKEITQELAEDIGQVNIMLEDFNQHYFSGFLSKLLKISPRAVEDYFAHLKILTKDESSCRLRDAAEIENLRSVFCSSDNEMPALLPSYWEVRNIALQFKECNILMAGYINSKIGTLLEKNYKPLEEIEKQYAAPNLST